MTQSDGRRAGPVALSEPTEQDRAQVAQIQAAARELAEQQAADLAAEAKPAGVVPSAEQRAAVVANEQRSADTRAQTARLPRAIAVGVVYDDEREHVVELHAAQRATIAAGLADRGAVDPVFEASSAGFDPTLPYLPGSELYGYFTCATCGGQIERAFPGFVDWDAASRDLVCPYCGARKSMNPAAADVDQVAEEPAQSVQTSAQLEAVQLAAEERAELEELRADAAKRDAEYQAEQASKVRRRAAAPAPAPDPTLPPPPPPPATSGTTTDTAPV